MSDYFMLMEKDKEKDSLINQLYCNAIKNNPMSLTPCEHYRDYIIYRRCSDGRRKIVKF